MTRSIRLVVAASSPVLSVDDETKMNAEKHECSLLKVVSDAGSTPAASTISKYSSYKTRRCGAMKIAQPRLTLGGLIWLRVVRFGLEPASANPNAVSASRNRRSAASSFPSGYALLEHLLFISGKSISSAQPFRILTFLRLSTVASNPAWVGPAS